jgi:hypothetical protein
VAAQNRTQFSRGRTAIKVPADYPPDLYWKGQQPKKEYNYLLVDVRPRQRTKFTLNRFRPWSAHAVRQGALIPSASLSVIALVRRSSWERARSPESVAAFAV